MATSQWTSIDVQLKLLFFNQEKKIKPDDFFLQRVEGHLKHFESHFRQVTGLNNVSIKTALDWEDNFYWLTFTLKNALDCTKLYELAAKPHKKGSSNQLSTLFNSFLKPHTISTNIVRLELWFETPIRPTPILLQEEKPATYIQEEQTRSRPVTSTSRPLTSQTQRSPSPSPASLSPSSLEPVSMMEEESSRPNNSTSSASLKSYMKASDFTSRASSAMGTKVSIQIPEQEKYTGSQSKSQVATTGLQSKSQVATTGSQSKSKVALTGSQSKLHVAMSSTSQQTRLKSGVSAASSPNTQHTRAKQVMQLSKPPEHKGCNDPCDDFTSDDTSTNIKGVDLTYACQNQAESLLTGPEYEIKLEVCHEKVIDKNKADSLPPTYQEVQNAPIPRMIWNKTVDTTIPAETISSSAPSQRVPITVDVSHNQLPRLASVAGVSPCISELSNSPNLGPLSRPLPAAQVQKVFQVSQERATPVTVTHTHSQPTPHHPPSPYAAAIPPSSFSHPSQTSTSQAIHPSSSPSLSPRALSSDWSSSPAAIQPPKFQYAEIKRPEGARSSAAEDQLYNTSTQAFTKPETTFNYSSSIPPSVVNSVTNNSATVSDARVNKNNYNSPCDQETPSRHSSITVDRQRLTFGNKSSSNKPLDNHAHRDVSVSNNTEGKYPLDDCVKVKAGGLSDVGGIDHSSSPFGEEKPGIFVSKIKGVDLTDACQIQAESLLTGPEYEIKLEVCHEKVIDKNKADSLPPTYQEVQNAPIPRMIWNKTVDTTIPAETISSSAPSQRVPITVDVSHNQLPRLASVAGVSPCISELSNSPDLGPLSRPLPAAQVPKVFQVSQERATPVTVTHTNSQPLPHHPPSPYAAAIPPSSFSHPSQTSTSQAIHPSSSPSLSPRALSSDWSSSPAAIQPPKFQYAEIKRPEGARSSAAEDQLYNTSTQAFTKPETTFNYSSSIPPSVVNSVTNNSATVSDARVNENNYNSPCDRETPSRHRSITVDRQRLTFGNKSSSNKPLDNHAHGDVSVSNNTEGKYPLEDCVKVKAGGLSDVGGIDHSSSPFGKDKPGIFVSNIKGVDLTDACQNQAESLLTVPEYEIKLEVCHEKVIDKNKADSLPPMYQEVQNAPIPGMIWNKTVDTTIPAETISSSAPSQRVPITVDVSHNQLPRLASVAGVSPCISELSNSPDLGPLSRPLPAAQVPKVFQVSQECATPVTVTHTHSQPSPHHPPSPYAAAIPPSSFSHPSQTSTSQAIHPSSSPSLSPRALSSDWSSSPAAIQPPKFQYAEIKRPEGARSSAAEDQLYNTSTQAFTKTDTTFNYSSSIPPSVVNSVTNNSATVSDARVNENNNNSPCDRETPSEHSSITVDRPRLTFGNKSSSNKPLDNHAHGDVSVSNNTEGKYPLEDCVKVKAGGLSDVGGIDHSSSPFGEDKPGIFVSKIKGVDLTDACQNQAESLLTGPEYEIKLEVCHVKVIDKNEADSLPPAYQEVQNAPIPRMIWNKTVDKTIPAETISSSAPSQRVPITVDVSHNQLPRLASVAGVSPCISELSNSPYLGPLSRPLPAAQVPKVFQVSQERATPVTVTHTHSQPSPHHPPSPYAAAIPPSSFSHPSQTSNSQAIHPSSSPSLSPRALLSDWSSSPAAIQPPKFQYAEIKRPEGARSSAAEDQLYNTSTQAFTKPETTFNYSSSIPPSVVNSVTNNSATVSDARVNENNYNSPCDRETPSRHSSITVDRQRLTYGNKSSSNKPLDNHAHGDVSVSNNTEEKYPLEDCVKVKAGGLSDVGGIDHSSSPFGEDKPGIFVSKIKDVDLTDARQNQAVSLLTGPEYEIKLEVCHEKVVDKNEADSLPPTYHEVQNASIPRIIWNKTVDTTIPVETIMFSSSAPSQRELISVDVSHNQPPRLAGVAGVSPCISERSKSPDLGPLPTPLPAAPVSKLSPVFRNRVTPVSVTNTHSQPSASQPHSPYAATIPTTSFSHPSHTSTSQAIHPSSSPSLSPRALSDWSSSPAAIQPPKFHYPGIKHPEGARSSAAENQLDNTSTQAFTKPDTTFNYSSCIPPSVVNSVTNNSATVSDARVNEKNYNSPCDWETPSRHRSITVERQRLTFGNKSASNKSLDNHSHGDVSVSNNNEGKYPLEDGVKVKAGGLSVVGGIDHSSSPFGEDKPGIFVPKSELVEETFIIYCEKEVCEASIVSTEIEQLRKSKFDLPKQPLTLCKKTLKLREDAKGYYCYQFKTGSWFSSKWFPKETQSKEFFHKPLAVHRDIYLHKAAEIEAHLNDIICNTSYTSSEMCQQIQHVCSYAQSVVDGISIVVENMLKYYKYPNKISQSMCVFAIAELSRCVVYHIEYRIDEGQTLRDLVDSVATTSLNDFPAESHAVLIETCKLLYKKYCNDKYSLCKFLDKFLNFLGDNVLQELESFGSNSTSHQEQFTGNDYNALSVQKNLVINFQSSNKFYTIISLLVKNSPFILATKLVHYIDEFLVDPYKTEIIELIGCKAVEHVCSKKEKTELIEMADEFIKIDLFANADFFKFAEKLIWEIIFENWRLQGKQIKNVCFLLEQIIKKPDCFSEPEIKMNVVGFLAQSSIPEFRQQFLKVIQTHAFTSTLYKIENNIYETWLKSELKPVRDNKGIERAFVKFSDLLTLKEVDKNTVQEAIWHVADEVMKSISFKDLLQSMTSVEYICDEEACIFQLFKSKMLSHIQMRKESPLDIIRQICTDGILKIDTKTRSEIACDVVDVNFNEKMSGDTSNMHDFFTSQIKHAEFWSIVNKAEGKHCSLLQEHKTVSQFLKILHSLASEITERKVTVDFLTKINILDEHTKMLLKQGGLNDDDMDQLHYIVTENRECLQKSCDEVCFVLNKLPGVMQNIPDLKDIIEFVKCKSAHLKSTTILVREIEFPKQFWGTFEKLPKLCNLLHPFVDSKVFENVVDTESQLILKQQVGSEDCSDDAIVSNRFLFEPLLKYSFKLMSCLEYLTTNGIAAYKVAWETLESTPETVSMTFVMHMFLDSHISDEIIMYEKRMGSIANSVKHTLQQIEDSGRMFECVEVIKSLLKAFGYNDSADPDIQSALNSANNLRQMKGMGDISFAVVERHINVVNKLIQDFNEDSNAIMEQIANSSHLLDFVKEIDEDVRTLIDAVEDFSESHVQESTVSALIEAKNCLLPIFQHKEIKNDISSFLRCVYDQIMQLKDAKTFPAKICECTDNVHNLKSLYHSVANRGQQTREVIKSIVSVGDFVFELRTNCVTLIANYMESQNNHSVAETTLVDLRSRALLLLNTDGNADESTHNACELKEFVRMIDCSLSIKETLLSLHVSGHMDYFEYKQTVPKSDLENVIGKLTKHLHRWNKELKDCRCQFYLMNYLNGCQVHCLYKYLEKNTSEEDVKTFLKFIHKDIPILRIKDKYASIKVAQKGKSFVFMIGQCLHEVYSDLWLKAFKRVVTVDEEMTLRFSEVCHKGRLMLVNLDENSDFVVRTILALYYYTFICLPEPSQVIFCFEQTSYEDIDLLIERCLGAKSFYGDTLLFCIANVEKLSSEMQFHLVDRLRELEKSQDFRLAVICRGSKNHPFVDRLSDYKSMVQPVSDKLLSTIFFSMFPDVTTYSSELAGLGKSSLISKTAREKKRSVVTLHISGHVSRDEFVAELKVLNLKDFHDLHLEIGSVHDPRELDNMVFELIVLSYVAVGRTAFAVPTNTIYIEIANSINSTLANSLPTVTSFKKKHLQWTNFKDYTASRELNSPNQVVCKYLKALKENNLDTKEVHLLTAPQLSEEECRDLLRSTLDMTADISYSVVHTFLNVLADQLKKFSCSVFFRVQNICDMIGGGSVMTVRSSLIKAMVEVSKEFACRSVQSCRSTQMSTLTNDESHTKENDLATKLVKRTDSMVRWEDSNHLMYVFHNQNIQTLSPMYRDREKVPKAIQLLFETQLKKTLENYAELDQNKLQDILQRVARTDPSTLKKETLCTMATRYALTPDNLLKMVLIMLRIQTNVPVLVMGETGCGKTSLIRYLAQICEVHFIILNIHAGITNQDVIDIVRKEHEQCLSNPKIKRWLFLDEINTTECIGIICDIICHRTCRGCILAPNLTVMGACNPYKLRTSEAIFTAGLSGKVKTDDLSKLVYRVLPLPEMMVDYVWDFGSLSDTDEKKYIERMSEPVFVSGSEMHTLLRDLISASHIFVRGEEKTTCVVSLRDVSRCINLVSWFLKVIKENSSLFQKPEELSGEIKAIILALTHCYHSRFTKKETRKLYRQLLVRQLIKPTGEKIQAENDVNKIIQEAQSEFLNRMELPSGTAKNTALKENVFMILVCILNKIPIFVVGKPGCSKSLAMQIIRSNLRGKDSKDEFFKTQPQLYCISFQGSESSTFDGILKVFEKAEKYQESNSKDDVLSVVILDEIGLAEISRFNPLKVLHNLLEPNGQSFPNVAVVGISNWSLDASKMNRAIHLSRPDMDKEELFDTATSICQSFVETIKHKSSGMLGTQIPSKLHLSDISAELSLIASAYTSYTEKLQFKHFHGLRDFYALVKFISKRLATETVKKSDGQSKAIMEGLQRNFGGLKSERGNLEAEFEKCILHQNKDWQVLDLIKDNINDTVARHLMIIIRGESVLGLLEEIIKEAGRNKPEIIFGSQFEEDLTDDYHYRILSRIILCMEQGIVLILKDLEHIYGSLYDMLNQNYTRIGKKNTCRVALGPYSNPFCHVSDSFRCIVLVEANQLHKTDPPFLNRFEKQYLSFADILSEEERQLAQQINAWIDNVSNIKGRSFSKHDIFPFYNDDLIISLVIFVTRKEPKKRIDCTNFKECIETLMWIITPDAVLRLRHAIDESIRMDSRKILMDYFELPLHDGLENLIEFHHKQHQLTEARMCVVFTNSNIHTRLPNMISGLTVQTENLGTFKSEKKLPFKLKDFWQSNTNVLLIYCHASDDEHHLTLTMSIVNKLKIEAEEHSKFNCYKIVYMILHMGVRIVHGTTIQEDDLVEGSIGKITFLSGWELITLESLEKPSYSVPVLSSQTLKQAIDSMRPLTKHLQDELFWSFTRIGYGRRSRNVESVLKVIEDIRSSELMLYALESKIIAYIEDTVDSLSNEEWCVNIACNANALNMSSQFVDALLGHIRSTIKTPLAKLIAKLEQFSALDSFFINDVKASLRQNYWLSIFIEGSFSIHNVNDETGPESFQCSNPDLGLKVPFGRQIYEDIERTKDTFLIEVASAKVKCDIEAKAELPCEVMSELIQQHKDIISFKSIFDEFAGYNAQCFKEDYLEDYCNQLSYQCCYGLQRMARIEITSWAMSQIIDISELTSKSPLEALASLHCTGWVHLSTFNSLLQLCSVFDAGISSVVSQVRMFDSVTENKYHEDAQHDGALDSLKEDIIYSRENDSNDTPDLCNNECDVINENPTDGYVENTFDDEHKFGSFVSRLCSVAMPTTENHTNLSSSTHWENVLRNLVLAARNISDRSKEYHALRLCSDIYSIAVVQNKISEHLLFDLGISLNEHDIDSSFVQKNILEIVKVVYKSGSATALFRIARQYLISCISSNDETNCFFVFHLLNNQMIPKELVHLLKFPFEVRIDCEVNEGVSLLQQIIKDNEASEHSFLYLLNNCLINIIHDQNEIHPFSVMIADLLEAQFHKIAYDSDEILESGRVLQKWSNGPIGLKIIASVAYIRSFTRYLGVRENPEDLIEDKLMDAYVCMLNGLEQIQIGHHIHILLLKYICNGEGFTGDKGGKPHLAKGACISSAINLNSIIINTKKLEYIISWSEQYTKTCLEMNTLCLHENKELVMKACNCFETEQKSHVKIIFKIVLEGLSHSDGKVHQANLAFFLSLKEFYLPKFIKMLNDTEKSLAEPLEDLFKKYLTSVQKVFLRCTLGLEDFLDSRLVHSPQTQYQQFVLNTVLVTSYALALASSEETNDSKTSPPATRCLLFPLEQDVFSLTGVSCKTTSNNFQSINTTTCLYYCNCGTVMVFHEHYSEPKCKACDSDVDVLNTQSAKIIKTELCNQETQKNSSLSTVAQKILQFLGDGWLLGSLALRITTTEQVMARCAGNEPTHNIFDFIWMNLQQNWNSIKEMLNISDFETSMLFHLIMEKGKHLLFKGHHTLDTSEQVLKWETEFENVVEKIEDNIFQEMSLINRNTDNMFGLSSQSVELQIRESDVSCAKDSYLFRQTRVATKADFGRQLYRRKDIYPFLQYVVDNEGILSLPVHIYNIIQWHLSNVANVNFNFKRNDCLNKTVNEFHNLLKENSIKQASKKRFNMLKLSWNALSKQSTDLIIEPIDIKSKMCDCLLLSQDGQIYRVLKFLIDTQNQCIENALHLSKDCSSLQFLLRSPAVSSTRSVLASEVRKEDLIAIDDTWVEFIHQESHCGLQYGEGRRIHYDFMYIEKRLAEKLLFGKAYVSFNDLPNIVFIDKLYRNFLSLVEEVCMAVKQTCLPKDLETQLRKKSEDNKGLSFELLYNLDMLLTVLKRSKSVPEEPITEFVKKRKATIRGFPVQHLPTPENRLCLCHVISLHEVLEEISAERTIEGLGDEYNAELEEEEMTYFKSIKSVHKLEPIIKAIKRFTYRCIFMTDISKEESLIQYLSQPSFWSTDDSGKSRIPIGDEDVHDIFLPDILVCHIGTIYKTLTETIEKLQQGEVKIDRVITSWKAKSEPSSRKQTQKKGARKLRDA